MSALDPQAVLAALRRVVPAGAGPVALHEPFLGDREREVVADCLASGWVSSAGPYVERFEEQLAGLLGAPHAVACVNGTAALHVCLELAGVERGDEVLVPALTFVATANAVTYAGAVPHFVDSEERTLGLDPAKLAAYLAEIAEEREVGSVHRDTGRRIAAVVPMHCFGHPVDMDPLLEVAARHRIAVVEDAAEALGSRYRGRSAGALGALAALSFNGNKIVTTGGGGAVVTGDAELARRARHLTTTAKVPHRWAFVHDRVGYNYRLPGLNAALGCAQLEQLPDFLAAKRALAERYREAFAGLAGLRFVTEPDFARCNYWLNALLLDEAEAGRRDAVLELTNDAGVMTRPAWTLMSELPMFADCPRMDLSTAESLSRRLINLPSSAALGRPANGGDREPA